MLSGSLLSSQHVHHLAERVHYDFRLINLNGMETSFRPSGPALGEDEAQAGCHRGINPAG